MGLTCESLYTSGEELPTFEALDNVPSPEDQVLEQITARTVQELLRDRYGETAGTIIAVFARWHELVYDDGVPPTDAYGLIVEEFDVFNEQFTTRQRELRSMPDLGGLAGPRLESEHDTSAPNTDP